MVDSVETPVVETAEDEAPSVASRIASIPGWAIGGIAFGAAAAAGGIAYLFWGGYDYADGTPDYAKADIKESWKLIEKEFDKLDGDQCKKLDDIKDRVEETWPIVARDMVLGHDLDVDIGIKTMSGLARMYGMSTITFDQLIEPGVKHLARFVKHHAESVAAAEATAEKINPDNKPS